MKSNVRRPRLHARASKGQRTHFKQIHKKFFAMLAMAAAAEAKSDHEARRQNWNMPKVARAQWLRRFFMGNQHKPHQGQRERQRRQHQMMAHKCINPEAWLYRCSDGEYRQLSQECPQGVFVYL